jgi:hypothetical protein
VLLERVSDREVPVGDDGATDLALDALVLGGLVDDEVLRPVEARAVSFDGALPACHYYRSGVFAPLKAFLRGRGAWEQSGARTEGNH